MKVLNTLQEDYHIHSLNFSDGMNTVDEIVQYAGKIGLREIAITDHSQAVLDYDKMSKKCGRIAIGRWTNVYNDVKVIFGVEGDLLNDSGDCCFDIQGIQSDFLILSYHRDIFVGDLQNLTQAYINAIKKHSDKIKCIGHICKKGTAEYLDIEHIVKTANEYHIPVEFNSAYFNLGRTDMKKLDIMLGLVNQLYVNSDAHTLSGLTTRKPAFDYLKEKGYTN